MELHLIGKTILVVEGSLLDGAELADAVGRAGGRVNLTTNIINAFGLLDRTRFDGAMIDQGLHNESFELYGELRDLGIPYICCAAPHRLQKAAVKRRDADHAVRRLGTVISAQAGVPSGSTGLSSPPPGSRNTIGA